MEVVMYNCTATEVDTSDDGCESIFFKDPGNDEDEVRVFVSREKLATLRDQIDAALKEQHEPATD